jgi:hypothetical protein
MTESVKKSGDELVELIKKTRLEKINILQWKNMNESMILHSKLSC